MRGVISSEQCSPLRRSRWHAACRIAITVVLVAVAGLLLAGVIGAALWNHAFAYDFRYSTRDAGLDVLHGTTPYVSPDAINAHGPGAATGSAPTWFVYPAPAALLFVPFALLPLAVGEVLFTLLCLAAVWASLRLVDVRGWKWYVLVLLWPGVISGIQSANLSLFLLLGLALAWRFRDRPLASGATVGLLIALKLFVWPLAIWLAATRRYMQLGYAVATGVLVNIAGWAIVGFDQIPRYRELLAALTHFEHGQTSSWTDVLLRAGASDPVARAVPLAIAIVACAGILALGRRRDDRGALTFAVIATLAATPIMWSHYYSLLLIPAVLLFRALRSRWQRDAPALSPSALSATAEAA